MSNRDNELGLSMDSGETIWVQDRLDLEKLLKESKPESLKLIGDWNNVSLQSPASGASVRKIWIRGESIKSIEGLNAFQRLNHLLVESSTPPQIDFSGVSNLLSASLQWKDAGTLDVLSKTPVSRLTLAGSKGSDLSQWPSTPNLVNLTLTRPQFESLSGIGSLVNLRILDIRLAAKLKSTSDLSAPVEELTVTNAPNLKSLDLGTSRKSLRRIGIFEAPESLDLTELYECRSIEKITTGGKRGPPLDWKKVLAISSLRHVQGLVDSEFERTLARSGRDVTDRREFGTKSRRWVELVLG